MWKTSVSCWILAHDDSKLQGQMKLGKTKYRFDTSESATQLFQSICDLLDELKNDDVVHELFEQKGEQKNEKKKQILSAGQVLDWLLMKTSPKIFEHYMRERKNGLSNQITKLQIKRDVINDLIRQLQTQLDTLNGQENKENDIL